MKTPKITVNITGMYTQRKNDNWFFNHFLKKLIILFTWSSEILH